MKFNSQNKQKAPSQNGQCSLLKGVFYMPMLNDFGLEILLLFIISPYTAAVKPIQGICASWT